jgi:hypothetical protein
MVLTQVTFLAVIYLAAEKSDKIPKEEKVPKEDKVPKEEKEKSGKGSGKGSRRLQCAYTIIVLGLIRRV